VAAVFLAIAVLGIGLVVSAPPGSSDATNDLSQYYGFREIEFFKLEQRSGNMRSGDLNDDGLTDLILVDNSHSRLDLLLQRKQKPTSHAGSGTLPVNEVGADWRFEHRKIPVDKQVASLTLGDFNNDGRIDVAYFGVPDRLIVRYQSGSDQWSERRSFRLPDVNAVSHNLAGGDLNGDDRDDLVVLGENVTYVVYQQADGQLSRAETLMNTSNKLSRAQIADLDGDGRNDLCYLAAEAQTRILCARLQDEQGRLGPELRFDLENPRLVTLFDIDARPGSEIITIEPRTDRLKLLQLEPPRSKPGELAGRLIQYGFGQQDSGRGRDLALGDVNGDGLTDVVVTDPQAARMIVFRQRNGQGLDLGTPFPGLLGVEHVRIADVDGDKTDEVLVLSVREKTLGLSRLREGRLTFPHALPVVDEPLALELADLDEDGRVEIVYIARKRAGRDSKYALHALSRAENGEWKPYRFGDEMQVPIALRGTPVRLVRLDANADGRPDFIVFLSLDRQSHLLTMNTDGVLVEVSAQGGIGLGNASAGSVFVGRLEKPAVLVAQQNFGRNLQLGASGRWQVVDQYNAAEAKAKIVGIAALDLDGRPGNEVVLVDSGINKLRVLRREGALFRPWREVELGSFPYQSARVGDLNGDRRDDLVLFGRGKFAVLYAGRTDPTLRTIATFETKLRRTFFRRVVVGDLNGDGRADLAVLDTRSHYVELLDYDRKLGLRHALHFKLFEEKSFTAATATGTEPRQALIDDVTNDGRADLIILAHDRVLLFPQDDGRPESSAGKGR